MKGFLFKKENGTIVGIEGFRPNAGRKYMPYFQDTEALYNLSSMHTHASYLSVLQFGQSYNTQNAQQQLHTILISAYLILATVINNFLELDQCIKKSFIESHPKNDGCHWETKEGVGIMQISFPKRLRNTNG